MRLRSLPLLAGLVAITGLCSVAPASASVMVAKSTSSVQQAGDLYTTASALLRAHKYASAEIAFKRAIAHHVRTGDSYAGLGTAYFSEHRYPPAYTAYVAALKFHPNDPQIVFYAAYAGVYAGKYSEAVILMNGFIKAHPKNVPAYHLRFVAYGGLLDREHQVKDARTIVSLQPKNPAAYNDLGIALANNSKASQAFAAFTHAIKLEPGNYLYYKNRAIVDNMRKDKHQALADLKRAADLAPAGPEKRNLLALYRSMKASKKH